MESFSTSVWALVLAAVCGYFIGSLNPASWIAKARGIDLSSSGSGNPGATNAGRVMGRKTGILVMVLDVLKGVVPVLVFDYLFDYPAGELAGFFAILGHVTSPFLKGKGGKGVATTLGVVLAANWLWLIPMLIVFAIVFAITKKVGLGSVAAAVALIIEAWVFGETWPTQIFGTAVGLLVIARHWSNLRSAFSGPAHDKRESADNAGADVPVADDQNGDRKN